MKIIDTDLLDRTSAQARTEQRLRKNYNFHEKLDDPVNRLLNALEPGTYLPVHRHLNPAKDESVIVLRGSVASFIFNDRGEITACAVIDPAEGVYGFDIPAGEWHGLLVLQSGTVVFEAKPGPYVPVSPENMAPWTPADNDPEGIEHFLDNLQNELSERNKKQKI